MDILQEINLKLIAAFEKEGISFAYPVQRLYLEQQNVQSQPVIRMVRPGRSGW